MPFPIEQRFQPWLARLKQHINDECYSKSIAKKYPCAARAFLRDLAHRGQDLGSVSPADIERHIAGLKCLHNRQVLPTNRRREHRAAIQMLLRLVHDGKWPPQAVPTTADEIAMQEVVNEYDAWMKEVRGLAAGTSEHGRFEARSLLQWLRDHGKRVATLCVADLDAYIAARVISMRRRTRISMVGTLRGVLHYLHASGRIRVDLADAIEAAPIYALEDIPSTVRREDLDRALKAARCDRSPLGHRDYALLTLLSTYGLRAGEIIGLRVSDIDWRGERLRIRHTKTGTSSALPLLRGPADALLDYLKHGRPVTTLREVFLRAEAPYRALTRGGLYHVMSRRFRAVGVKLSGKRGAHVLRHSRAASLLSSGVSIKSIGDLLGHRSEQSTVVYLKLATEDLRAIALDLPLGMPS